MLLGDSSVGKTCVLVRFKDGAFLGGNFIATVGIDFRVREMLQTHGTVLIIPLCLCFCVCVCVCVCVCIINLFARSQEIFSVCKTTCRYFTKRQQIHLFIGPIITQNTSPICDWWHRMYKSSHHSVKFTDHLCCEAPLMAS